MEAAGAGFERDGFQAGESCHGEFGEPAIVVGRVWGCWGGWLLLRCRVGEVGLVEPGVGVGVVEGGVEWVMRR